MGKDKNSLGRALIKDRFGSSKGKKKVDNGSMLHTTEVKDGYDWGRLNLQSVTEESSFQEFLSTAQLAGTEFQAEKLNLRLVSLGGVEAVTSSEARAKAEKKHAESKHLLRVPRRPKWSKDMTAEQLSENEKQAFLDWRRDLSLLQEGDGMIMTPYEKNLEFWRQLWRVLERSQLLVQVLDARNPLLFRCEDLESYAKEVGVKSLLLLLNKADLLNHRQRETWAKYFDNQGVKIAFFSAVLASEQTKLERKKQKEGDDDDEFEEEEEESSDESETEDSADKTESLNSIEDIIDASRKLAVAVEKTASKIQNVEDRLTELTKHPAVTSDKEESIGQVIRDEANVEESKGQVIRDEANVEESKGQVIRDEANVEESKGQVIRDEANVEESKGQVIRDEANVEESKGQVIRDEANVEESKGQVIRDEANVEESKGQVIRDEANVEESKGQVIRDEANVEESKGQVIRDEANVEESKGQVIRDEANVEESKGQVIRDEAIVEESKGQVIRDEANVEESKGQVIRDEANIEESIGQVIRDEANVEESKGQVIRDEANVEEIKTKKVVTFDSNIAESSKKGDSNSSTNNDSNDRIKPPTDDVKPVTENLVNDKNNSEILTRDQLIELFANVGAQFEKSGEKFTVGMVGYPNVGKSSTINALMESKKVSVSATPGKTKHFQTLILSDDLMLCDCPGLVLPSFVCTKADMVVHGILPIDQMREYMEATTILSECIGGRKAAERKLGILLPPPPSERPEYLPPRDLLLAYAYSRGMMSGAGTPDCARAARALLRSACQGKLSVAVAPPGVNVEEFRLDESDGDGVLQTRDMTPQEKRALKSGDTPDDVDNAFFKGPGLTSHAKGVEGKFTGLPKVRVRTVNGSALHETEVTGKPWKYYNKHANKKKKEKLRRVYGHLDLH